MSKTNLPAEVHDHFRKANVLHTYVQENLGEATKHALETGIELLAAKKAIPHGSWESECARLFEGSLRTAQFYMQFAKDVGTLKSAQKSALLLLEGSLSGAAKAARQVARPAAPKPSRKVAAPASVTTASEPASQPTGGGTEAAPGPSTPDYGKCPNCAGTKWEEEDGEVSCAKCHHPWGEPAGDADEHTATQADLAKKQVKIWADTIARWLGSSPSIDEYRGEWPGPKGDRVLKAAKELYEALKDWPKAIK